MAQYQIRINSPNVRPRLHMHTLQQSLDLAGKEKPPARRRVIQWLLPTTIANKEKISRLRIV